MPKRSMFCGAKYGIPIVILLGAIMNSCAHMPTMPSLSLGSEEEIVQGGEGFLRECDAAIAALPENQGYEFGPAVITRSREWGLVLRRDFTLRTAPIEGLVNRVLCWADNDGKIKLMLAIGQENLDPIGTGE